MFDEHYKDGSFAGEKSRGFRLIGLRLGILLAIGVVALMVAGYLKWSKASLHDRLMKRHQVATAYYDKNFFRNSNGVYSVGYTFIVNGKRYHNNDYFKTIPTSPEGIVYYNPDDPSENKLQPFE
ncbi:MAG: hypothetical protein ABIR33_00630 [Pyrinomonadaceae bacterium]